MGSTLGFMTFPDFQASYTYRDIGPDSFTEPQVTRWDDYEVLVSSDLAVMKRYDS